jgi:PAS domain-containing protein
MPRVRAFTASQAELAAVRAHEQFLAALLRDRPDNLSAIDENWNILHISPAGADMLGYAPEELLGTLGAPQFGVAYRLRRKDGSWQPVTLFSTNAIDGPHVRGMIIHIRDATARQVRDEALARNACMAR